MDQDNIGVSRRGDHDEAVGDAPDWGVFCLHLLLGWALIGWIVAHSCQ